MRKKGTFGHLRLSVAAKYLDPPSRNPMLAIGLVLCLLFVGYALVDSFLGKNRFISSGPLSSNHANFESDCQACHTQFASVASEKCAVCHEKYGDKLGVYTYNAHYLYRSNDFRRLVSSENEQPCFTCHQEHLGREQAITNVPDSKCNACHLYGSFNENHPQFALAVNSESDVANLKFSHLRHVREIRNRNNIADLEKTCLYCHNPEPNGNVFRPIDFDQHCDACHLTINTATPWLQIQSGGRNQNGVATLEQLRAGRDPGLQLATVMSPIEFQQRGDRIRKTPLYHKDPWILKNLQLLRRRLYKDVGLPDLLDSSPDVAAGQSKRLYEEAIATLRWQATGLRSRPERTIQNELLRISQLLARTTQRLNDPYVPLDDTKFLLSTLTENPTLTEEKKTEITKLADELTKPCQVCHLVKNATILRVQKDQRILRRAEFNHRKHILQRRCLDCHTKIPIADLAATSNPAEAEFDNSSIQNLPHIEICQDCHRQEVVSNRCVTCHLFHPNKSQRSNLLLYIDAE